jgi:hypothetical protein
MINVPETTFWVKLFQILCFIKKVWYNLLYAKPLTEIVFFERDFGVFNML